MIETVTTDLPELPGRDGAPARVLVTGATGYVGGRLVRELLAHNYHVRVLARDARKVEDHSWSDRVEIIEGDAMNPESLGVALHGVDVAYYLLHALMVSDDFEQKERTLATRFSEIAHNAGVRRIVYLGGIVSSDEDLSAHMTARTDTGEILRASGIPTIELRAGLVIGSGSASFEILRHLTERLPIMVTPRWLNNRVQPIAIRDVLRYLVGAAAMPAEINEDFDIGGPDVFTYKEMMQQYAEVAGLRHRIIIPLPVLTPWLASGWIGLVTPVPVILARRLVASLKHEMFARDDRIRQYIPDPPQGRTPFKEAVRLALTRIKDYQVETRWSNASMPGTPSEPLPTDPDWAGGSIYMDSREYRTPDSVDTVWERVEAIGGDNGYSTGTWAWKLRGVMDSLIGGVGLRRGRRDPLKLIEGEALDFWRVETVVRPSVLRLRAEMKLPGRAWLEFTVTPSDDGGSLLQQRALFAPQGLFGHLYWWLVAPFHVFVFPSMAKKLAGPNYHR